jgi:hypothetical protein
MLVSLQEERKNVVAYYVEIQRHFDAHQLQHLYLTSPKYHMYREAGIVSNQRVFGYHSVLFYEKVGDLTISKFPT